MTVLSRRLQASLVHRQSRLIPLSYPGNMASDLSALLTSSKNLTSHLSRPDLPSVDLSLNQIEALSRRLVSRQPGTSTDTDRAYVVSFIFLCRQINKVQLIVIICLPKPMLMLPLFPTLLPISTLLQLSLLYNLYRIRMWQDISV